MRIFIGSSNEQYPVAKEIRRDLLAKLRFESPEIMTWVEWFKRGENNGLNTWEIITKAIDYFDCAVMLLAGDDEIEVRNENYISTRDNVLIESGAFAMAKGMDNVFLLMDKNDRYKIPSDYRGLNVIFFDYERGADNPDAYQTMCEKISQIKAAKVERFLGGSTSYNNYKNEEIIIAKEKEKRGKIR